MAEELKALAPHKSVFDLNMPRKVSDNLSMPKPVVATISSWMHYDGLISDPNKELLMDKLVDKRSKVDRRSSKTL